MYRKPMTPAEPDHRRDAGPAPGGPPPMPRWVKAFIAAVLILVVLFLVSMLLGVEHGPGRHATGGGSVAAVAPVQEAGRR